MEADTNISAIHGLKADINISKTLNLVFCFIIKNIVYSISCLNFFSKTSKIRIYELKFFR